MPSTTPQFTLYSHRGGPNPWKVAIILEELSLTYTNIFLEINGEQKQAPYTNLCPNGRMPTLVDHSNNDYAIWESGAIILYIVSRYDKEKKISFSPNVADEETGQAVQWLMFQMSGQGPYYGQAMWFTRYHPGDKIPSAITRYTNEIRRVLSVIDKDLTDNNKEWLVGGKVSYADLSFVPWNWFIDFYFEELKGWREEFPKAAEWDRRLNERVAVKKCRDDRSDALGKERGYQG